jgi:hypothetical protein
MVFKNSLEKELNIRTKHIVSTWLTVEYGHNGSQRLGTVPNGYNISITKSVREQVIPMTLKKWQ